MLSKGVKATACTYHGRKSAVYRWEDEASKWCRWACLKVGAWNFTHGVRCDDELNARHSSYGRRFARAASQVKVPVRGMYEQASTCGIRVLP